MPRGRPNVTTVDDWERMIPFLLEGQCREKIRKALDLSHHTVNRLLRDIGVQWVSDDPKMVRGIGHYELDDGSPLDEQNIKTLVPTRIRQEEDGMAEVTDKDLRLAQQEVESKIGTLRRDHEDELKAIRRELPTRDYVDQSIQRITDQFQVFQSSLEGMFQSALARSENGHKEQREALKSELDGVKGKLGEFASKEDLTATQQAVREQLPTAVKELLASGDFEQEVKRCVLGDCDDLVTAVEEQRRAKAGLSGQELDEEEHRTATDYFECPTCGPLFKEAATKDTAIRSAVLGSLTEEDIDALADNLAKSGYELRKPVKIW